MYGMYTQGKMLLGVPRCRSMSLLLLLMMLLMLCHLPFLL